MERRVIFEPWPGPWGRWAEKFSRTNLWRVQMILGDMDDAMSECYIQYLECKRRYASTVNDPKWFMALYKMCVISRFNDLSVKDSRYREVVDISVTEDDGFDAPDFFLDTHVSINTTRDKKGFITKHDVKTKKVVVCHQGKSNHSDLGAVLSSRISGASKELRQVLYIMFNAPAEIVQTLSADCNSSKRFFGKIVSVLGISNTDSQRIQQELRLLLK